MQWVLLLRIMAACAAPTTHDAPPLETVPPTKARKVLIIGIDGLRPAALSEMVDENVTHMDVHATVMAWLGGVSAASDSTVRGF